MKIVRTPREQAALELALLQMARESPGNQLTLELVAIIQRATTEPARESGDCIVCGASMDILGRATNKGKKTCSGACKQRLWHSRNKKRKGAEL